MDLNAVGPQPAAGEGHSQGGGQESRALLGSIGQIVVPLALVLLVFAVYLPSMHGGFLWDDNTTITSNPAMKTIGGLRQIWIGKGGPDYYPLTLTLQWVEWHLWQFDTLGYHLVTVMLHAISVVLLWLLLERLSIPGAWLGAAIFAVHPVNVESVAWIAETKNTLSLVFYLAALLVYVRFLDRPRIGNYLGSLSLFLLALLAKTSVVMLPFVLLLLTWWRRRSVSRKDLLRCIPFLLLSAGMGITTLLVQRVQIVQAGGAPAAAEAFWPRVFGAGKIIGFYLGKAVFPYPLLTVYPAFSPGGIFPDLTIAAALLALWMLRDRTWAAAIFATLIYFVVSLVPVLGFIDSSYSVQFSPVADHYQYLALIGVAALAGAAISQVPGRHITGLIAGMALIAVLSVMLIVQERPYSSQVALFARLLEEAPYAPRAYTLLGTALLEQHRYPEALDNFESALAVDPNDTEAHYNMCAVLLDLGRWDDAVIQCRMALPANHANLGILIDLASALGEVGQRQESEQLFKEAIKLAPESATAHYDFALLLVKEDRLSEAEGQLQAALRNDPEMALAQKELAAVQEWLKQPDSRPGR